MCKLSNFYVVDLFDKTADNGSIVFNVANSLPQLMNTPCKIVVKQVQTAILFPGTGGNIDDILNFRVVHNMNIQSGTNYPNFSNSNTLCFLDTYKIRETSGVSHTTGMTETECMLYAPNGLPSILNLNRWGTANAAGSTDSSKDNSLLPWSVRLEITINPDQE
mgnify:CR=1 FL=1